MLITVHSSLYYHSTVLYLMLVLVSATLQFSVVEFIFSKSFVVIIIEIPRLHSLRATRLFTTTVVAVDSSRYIIDYEKGRFTKHELQKTTTSFTLYSD